jgi:RNA 3'-terminal phosphate cyclase-like protein
VSFSPSSWTKTSKTTDARCKRSPGYALTLLASSTSHVLHSSESTSCAPTTASTTISLESNQPNWSPPSPEDMGILAARSLLQEIRRGGCVDRGFEWLVSLMLVLGGEDVGRVTVGGPLDPFLCVLRSHSQSLNSN